MCRIRSGQPHKEARITSWSEWRSLPGVGQMQWISRNQRTMVMENKDKERWGLSRREGKGRPDVKYQHAQRHSMKTRGRGIAETGREPMTKAVENRKPFWSQQVRFAKLSTLTLKWVDEFIGKSPPMLKVGNSGETILFYSVHWGWNHFLQASARLTGAVLKSGSIGQLQNALAGIPLVSRMNAFWIRVGPDLRVGLCPLPQLQ